MKRRPSPRLASPQQSEAYASNTFAPVDCMLHCVKYSDAHASRFDLMSNVKGGLELRDDVHGAGRDSVLHPPRPESMLHDA